MYPSLDKSTMFLKISLLGFCPIAINNPSVISSFSSSFLSLTITFSSFSSPIIFITLEFNINSILFFVFISSTNFSSPLNSSLLCIK